MGLLLRVGCIARTPSIGQGIGLTPAECRDIRHIRGIGTLCPPFLSYIGHLDHSIGCGVLSRIILRLLDS